MAEPNNDPLQAGFPLLNKRALTTVAGVTVLVWVTAAMTGSKIVLVGVGILTAALAGLLFWAWRQAQKQQKMMQLLQQAQGSPEARQAALAQLALQDPKGADAIGQIAKAQIEAQESPDKALETLQGIDLSKVPGEAADQVRTFRAQLLLLKNRTREARDLADQINVPATGPKPSRAMMAAVVAEAYARTGKTEVALALLEEWKVNDPELEQMKPMLLYASVFANFAAGKKERAKKDMKALMEMDMNLLGRFVQPGPGIHIELRQIAGEVLQSHPDMRKMARSQQNMAHKRMR
jgi:tetratricopeptide (TPR) repeat protein